VISNLSWDFIYQHFLKVCHGSELIEYKAMVEMISQDYTQADLLLRLPGAHPMPAFDHITPTSLPSSSSSSFSSSPLVYDMPFVVRRARRSKQEVRRALGILSSSDSKATKLVLLVFGGQSGNVRWTPSMASLPENWVCAVCHAVWDPNTLDQYQYKQKEVQVDVSNQKKKNTHHGVQGGVFLRLERDVYLPDLIAASDVVLGKVGYGSVSECVCHRTPLVYVSRKNFAEEHYLKEVLEKYGNCMEMSFQDFQSGNWSRIIQEAARLRPTYQGRADGGLICAQTILRWMQMRDTEKTRGE
jgi:L-arabinokinase